ncbi:Uncharacterised protein [uncultured archaeon]|nr:Uncharacterised protein [uncultured archaeon]
MIKDEYATILKAVKEQGMLSERTVKKEHRETVDKIIKEGLMKHVKEKEYELTYDGDIALDVYKRSHSIKYRHIKIEGL